MSSNPNNTETAQQCCECLLSAQVERQQIRGKEITRQEAEFAAEMDQLEEEVAREEEEKRLAEERRVEEERQIAEEKWITKVKLAEERRIAEEKCVNEERLAEKKRVEEERVAVEKKKQQKELAEAKRQRELAEDAMAEAEEEQVQTIVFAKLVEENRKEHCEGVTTMRACEAHC
ncbi:hypothetical protein F5050DRAFT_1811685 [Lentinula boryana]|uniref:Uncharacterized protein n=1 Tax=Lentinula boryana TaxID=40481 RepID=A0ABQ8Q1I4_9AGAR|nr:hypothetical protein F5050DRAFT_1811685 [Lentinula boryana]